VADAAKEGKLMSPDFALAPRGGLAGYVERALKQGLLEGKLRPGQRLVTRDLAAQLGTSPTPVRDALLKLVSIGVLDTARSQAFQVPTISAERYQEIAEIRREIEGLAAARATALITDEEIAELRAANARFQAAKRKPDVAVALTENRAFRFGLYEAARMPILLQMIEQLWMQIGPTLNFLYPQSNTDTGEQHDYALILNALNRRDHAAVRAGIERAIAAGTEIVVANLTRRTEAAPAAESLGLR
jgi:GntR family colanic acid and biofilm gene transcriptional regulator